jgi:putative Ca2+/H+ antiporter (TMEM165/GDT1 family)
MDWKVFTTTFLTIFIAELGDKTQFAAFAAASQTQSIKSVLLGTVLALTIAGIIGVLAGNIVGQYIKPETMRYLSASAFLLMGFWILFKN